MPEDTRSLETAAVEPKPGWLAALRGARVERLDAAALLLIAVGSLLRLAYAFPTHKFVPDADSLLSGLRTLDILGGKLRVFYSYVRIGALECYMHVPAMWLLGVSRAAISVAPLLSAVATLVFFFLFVRELLGRRTAAFALLFLALPPPAYIGWTYMPNGYPETVLLCASTLYLAARIARGAQGNGWPLTLGLSVGLGLWQSFQTLTCALPAGIWLFACRPDLLRRKRFLLIGFAGLVLGSSPWILYNLKHPWGTFRGNFVVQPVVGAQSVAANAAYFFRYNLPHLLTGIDFFHPPTPTTKLENLLRVPVLAVYALGFLAFVSLASLRRRRDERFESPGLRSAGLVLLIAATIGVSDVVSAAGAGRGLTVRYVLPLLFVAAVALGASVSLLWRRSRFVAATAAGIVLLFNVLGYEWPWTAYRQAWRQLDQQDRALVSFLEGHGVRWICGNYWVVYPFNFISVRQVTAVPFQPDHDHYAYAQSLSPGPSNWALVTVDPNTLRVWLRNLPLEGRVDMVVNRFYVFLPSERERAKWRTGPLVDALQKTAPAGH
jgi:4-amino-4-deoxy-L-arabinose transferase-like glycosyltransferase